MALVEGHKKQVLLSPVLDLPLVRGDVLNSSLRALAGLNGILGELIRVANVVNRARVHE